MTHLDNTKSYDLDGDGKVSEADVATATLIQAQEDAARKHLAQLRLARSALVGIGVYTILMFAPFVPDERIKLLTSISDLFYISMASIVGAYMGFSSYMSKK